MSHVIISLLLMISVETRDVRLVGFCLFILISSSNQMILEGVTFPEAPTGDLVNRRRNLNDSWSSKIHHALQEGFRKTWGQSPKRAASQRFQHKAYLTNQRKHFATKVSTWPGAIDPSNKRRWGEPFQICLVIYNVSQYNFSKVAAVLKSSMNCCLPRRHVW